MQNKKNATYKFLDLNVTEKRIRKPVVQIFLSGAGILNGRASNTRVVYILFAARKQLSAAERNAVCKQLKLFQFRSFNFRLTVVVDKSVLLTVFCLTQ